MGRQYPRLTTLNTNSRLTIRLAAVVLGLAILMCIAGCISRKPAVLSPALTNSPSQTKSVLQTEAFTAGYSAEVVMAAVEVPSDLTDELQYVAQYLNLNADILHLVDNGSLDQRRALIFLMFGVYADLRMDEFCIMGYRDEQRSLDSVAQNWEEELDAILFNNIKLGTRNHLYYRLRQEEAENPRNNLAQLADEMIRRHPDLISIIEPNCNIGLPASSDTQLKNGPKYSYAPLLTSATIAWENSKGINVDGDPVYVAVFDSGVQMEPGFHPDLQWRIHELQGAVIDNPWAEHYLNHPVYNEWFNSGDEYFPGDDDSARWENDVMSNLTKYGHGTKICGIVGAEDNDFGVVGIAPEVRIIPIRIYGYSHNVFLGGTTDVLKQGVLNLLSAATQLNVRVANWSFTQDNEYGSVVDAVRHLTDAEVAIVAPNNHNDDDSHIWPGIYPDTISIGPSSWQDAHLAYGYLPTGDAVGFEYPSPELFAPSSGLGTTLLLGEYSYDQGSYWASGISFGVPVVAGVAALIAANSTTNHEDPGFISAEEIRKRLGQYAKPLWHSPTESRRVDATALTPNIPLVESNPTNTQLFIAQEDHSLIVSQAVPAPGGGYMGSPSIKYYDYDEVTGQYSVHDEQIPNPPVPAPPLEELVAFDMYTNFMGAKAEFALLRSEQYYEGIVWKTDWYISFRDPNLGTWFGPWYYFTVLDGSSQGQLTFEVYDFEMGDGNFTIIGGSDVWPYYTKDLYIPNYITGTLVNSNAYVLGEPVEIECPTWGIDHILYVRDNGSDHYVYGYQPVVTTDPLSFSVELEAVPRHEELANPAYLLDLGYCLQYACWGAYDSADNQVEWEVFDGLTGLQVRDSIDTDIDSITNATGLWVGGEESIPPQGYDRPILNIVIEEVPLPGQSDWVYALRCIQTGPVWVDDDIGGLEPLAVYHLVTPGNLYSSSIYLDESRRFHIMASYGNENDPRTTFYIPNEQRYDSSYERPFQLRGGNDGKGSTLDWGKLHPGLRNAPAGL